MRFRTSSLAWVATLLLAISLIAFTPTSAEAGRSGGSFGGGHSSFGGGGHSSFGGGSRGSFGGSSHSSFGSSGGSFGRSSSSSSSSFGRSSSPSAGGSFGRSGTMGSSNHVNSTSLGRPSYASQSYTHYVPSYSYGGYGYGRAYYYGGWGDYSYSPWYWHWMPFHPAFYYGPPVYYDGGYYPGAFSWGRLFFGIISILIIISIIGWIIGRIFGGGKGVRYTNY